MLQITQCKHPKGVAVVIMSKFNNPKNILKYYQMCTKKKVHIFNVCKIIIQSLNIKE